MILDIIQDLDFLRKKSKTVIVIDDELRELVSNMVETMEAHNGVGISAPQVGLLKKIIIVKPENDIFVFINPSITSYNSNMISMEEGCLSIPNYSRVVSRFSNIKIEALDLSGSKIKMGLSGLFARIFQHELDHLNGILISDKSNKKID